MSIGTGSGFCGLKTEVEGVMNIATWTIWRRTAFLALFGLAIAHSAAAAEPSATAALSSSQTAVGQPVQIEIRVTGASNPKPPGEILVDGLDIRSAGVSRQYQMSGFNVSYSFTFN
ncbi:MAG: hypothetical protein H0T11_07465, partial [Chthoniobacterales bacterium]|nr:hypothetical protein [Chthoniobacterales bacterium]